MNDAIDGTAILMIVFSIVGTLTMISTIGRKHNGGEETEAQRRYREGRDG